MKLPHPRGPLSDAVITLVSSSPDAQTRIDEVARDAVDASTDLATDDDVQLALYVMNELAYRGFDGVDDDWEWDPELLRARRIVETAFEDALRRVVQVPSDVPPERSEVAAALFAMTAPAPGPSVARYVAKRATREQLDEFLVLRSIYQLKEADPHTWAIPRLTGGPKAALVEIQADEYGGGDPERMHCELFARTMRGAGLDADYGAYVERIPAITLAALNLMSLFGLHRRLRGATAGHLAAFEMTSSLPNRLYGDGFRRHGFDEGTTLYFDEHVEADAVHEQIAGRDLAGALAQQEPELCHDILFGAAACLYLDDLAGEHTLSAWTAGGSALRAIA
ncbi:iron-containing redox enzyme family protein [Cellulomonas rhizosphaerae]|uniref:Iron-containing redox enzyme family protein n=1 Tax=Cellulomonas rhizosphaerae TaxID=2293719 RepID=A0A413RP95_9CELL|nr:iron-containing redox enzyme family protein [Cellulomonas rhizosphaerae]RHA43730.1 iron-containing redox enzyme family protein [Cellulomonas rhizosphaerae]